MPCLVNIGVKLDRITESVDMNEFRNENEAERLEESVTQGTLDLFPTHTTAPIPVYTDGVHMFTDWADWIFPTGIAEHPWEVRTSLLEDSLHAVARRAGLRRSWFQERARYPHYDLTTPPAAERAVRSGAILVEWRDYARLASAPGKTLRPIGYMPSLLAFGDIEERVRLAKEANVRLMRMFAGSRRVGRRGDHHLRRES